MAITQPFPSSRPHAALVGRPASLAGRLRRAMRDALHHVLAGLAERARIARERRRLGELDGRLLRDIGLTHAEARREARRYFWD